MNLKNQKINHNTSLGLDCIWVGSNIIENKICEINFDCENCTLDKILKNLYPANVKRKSYKLNNTHFIDSIINKIDETNFDSRLIYLKNNLILKNIYANIYFLGINPIMVSLLDNITEVKEYMKKVYFIKDDKILIIEGEWGSKTLDSSLNFLLLEKLNWTPEDISNNKWLALVAVNQNDIEDVIISYNQWNFQKTKILKLLNDYKTNCLCISLNEENNSEELKYFYELIGEKEYLNILNNILTE